MGGTIMNKWLNNMLLNLVLLAIAIGVGTLFYQQRTNSHKKKTVSPSSSIASKNFGDSKASELLMQLQADTNLSAQNKKNPLADHHTSLSSFPTSPPAWAKVLKEVVALDVMTNCLLQKALAPKKGNALKRLQESKAWKDGNASKQDNPLNPVSDENAESLLEGMSKRFGGKCTLYRRIKSDFELTVKAMEENTLSKGKYYKLIFYIIDINRAEAKTGWFVNQSRCEFALNLALEAGMAAEKCVPIVFKDTRANDTSNILQ
jgi:hypothetical protein